MSGGCMMMEASELFNAIFNAKVDSDNHDKKMTKC